MLTTPQLLSFAVIAMMMAAFVWGRLRYDLVAALALLAGVVAGVVPVKEAFSGFSDDIVIIVGSALLVSAGVARSGIMDYALRRYLPDLTTVRLQIALLVIVVAVLSAFVKNIGALAIMMPDRLPVRAALQHLAVDIPDADGLRLAARRSHDAGRHVARTSSYRGCGKRSPGHPSACSTSPRSGWC